MLPRQTQQQNRTLEIQIPDSTVSGLANPPSKAAASLLPPWRYGSAVALCRSSKAEKAMASEGVGSISGWKPSNNADPAIPTDPAMSRPGADRSIRNQRTGFTRARVRDTCKVESHGSLRYISSCQLAGRLRGTGRNTHNSKSDTNKGPDASNG